ncbi:MAG TPA: alanine--tRNA ligase, partial [candidate division Zixibacteria bacterium]|nr:alanine--tRNA ligase [candidate division Zixibacteria bacterium]
MNPDKKQLSSGFSAAEIRAAFLQYFADRDHKVLPSSPVIPFEDPTLLFTNAGMNQFKRVFTGEERPPHPRAATVQKCMRAGGKHNDLENVGFTTRHHTFFEMLGNFSFGDYFKERAIEYAWDMLTNAFGIDPALLYATVYEDDDEAFALWEKIAPELKNGRILRFGKSDNFWSMGDVGPCGPCSEIHFDRGERFGAVSDTNCVNGDGERFVEVWNLVFMQYNQTTAGEMVSLPKGSVDTGMGLERIAVALQGVDSNYDIDLFVNIIKAIEDVTGARYRTDAGGASHRVVADHLRALCFCIADGGGISNEKQGYVLRRILRRAARHGRLLGSHDPFIYKLVSALVNEMGAAYPELKEKEQHITKVIRAEEESFGRTLDTGLTLFDAEVKKLAAAGATVIPGEVVFTLYDTHGFPVDLTEVMARERGLTIDMTRFDEEMGKQRARARAASTMSVGVAGGTDAEHAALAAVTGRPTTKFVRDTMQVDANILALETESDGTIVLILDQTPFYVEAGGQISDIGTLYNDAVEIDVCAVYAQQGYVFHVGKLLRGAPEEIKSGGALQARINVERRRHIMRNHTATHLMHAALRNTLGDHVRQAGSLVSDEKLRFDFTHFEQP